LNGKNWNCNIEWKKVEWQYFMTILNGKKMDGKNWSFICIQLLLFQRNRNNFYHHYFPITLMCLDPPCRKSTKTQSKTALSIFFLKTPTLYKWTT